MKRLMLCVSVLALAVSASASAGKNAADTGSVAAATANGGGLYCLRGERTIQAFPITSWEACEDLTFDYFDGHTHRCTPVTLDLTNDRFRVYFKGDDLRLDIIARGNRVAVRGLSMLPTFDEKGDVVFYQGGEEGIHYYLFQKEVESPTKGYWYVEIFDTENMAPECNLHRMSAPKQMVSGSCPSRGESLPHANDADAAARALAPAARPQGATGGGGGNKPVGLAEASCR